jgi:polyisoprenoid-binding protein YceI
MTTTKWVLDPTHSEVLFKIKHLMITNVTGNFKTFDVTAETEGDDFLNAKIAFSANVNSITTNNDQRDGHLKSPDFFDIEKFPEIKFESTKFNREGDGENFELIGNLTIKDITKEVKLLLEFGGIAKDPYGNIKAGFSVIGKINRANFGLTWNAVLEAGGVAVSEEVRIAAEIQMLKGK